MIKVGYQVRFDYYHYNDGYTANGYYTYKSSIFTEIEDAQKMCNSICEQPCGVESSEWLSDTFNIDGYIESSPRLFKITEEEIDYDLAG